MILDTIQSVFYLVESPFNSVKALIDLIKSFVYLIEPLADFLFEVRQL